MTILVIKSKRHEICKKKKAQLMPPTPSNDRETRILDAALELALHYGIDKTTVSDIAREAGIAKGTIYLHHDSKDDLFEAVIWREIWEYVDAMLAYLESDTEIWSFVGMYRHTLKIIDGNLLMQAMISNDERILGNFMQRRGLAMGAFKRPFQAQLLQMMQEAGAIRQDIDLEVAAYLMTMLNYGFIITPSHIPPEQRPPIEATIEGIGDMLDHYLTPPDGGNQQAARESMAAITRRMRDHMQKKTADPDKEQQNDSDPNT
jgi:AcrR family transcriptional regulator